MQNNKNISYNKNILGSFSSSNNKSFMTSGLSITKSQLNSKRSQQRQTSSKKLEEYFNDNNIYHGYLYFQEQIQILKRLFEAQDTSKKSFNQGFSTNEKPLQAQKTNNQYNTPKSPFKSPTVNRFSLGEAKTKNTIEENILKTQEWKKEEFFQILKDLESLILGIFNKSINSSTIQVSEFSIDNKTAKNKHNSNIFSSENNKQQSQAKQSLLDGDKLKEILQNYMLVNKRKFVNLIQHKDNKILKLTQNMHYQEFELKQAKKLACKAFNEENLSQRQLKTYFQSLINGDNDIYRLKIAENRLKIAQLNNLVEDQQLTIQSLEELEKQYQYTIRNFLKDKIAQKQENHKLIEEQLFFKKSQDSSKFQKTLQVQSELTKRCQNDFIKLSNGLQEFKTKMENRVKIIVQKSEEQNQYYNQQVLQLKEILKQTNDEKLELIEKVKESNQQIELANQQRALDFPLIIQMALLIFNQGSEYLQNFILLSEKCLQFNDVNEDIIPNKNQQTVMENIQTTMEKIEVIHKEFIEFITQVYSDNTSVEQTCQTIKENIEKFITECKILQDTVIKSIN